MGTIRFLLALSVLVTHSAPILGARFLNGDMAVICFFVVSGFLMAMILETKYKGRLRDFSVNRVLRIYPPYLTALLFAAVIFYLIPNGHHNPYKSLGILLRTGHSEFFWGAIASNLTLIGADFSRYINFTNAGEIIFPNFLHRGEGRGAHNLFFVPQAWTLPLELMFYFMAPLVVKMRTRWIVCFVIVVGLVYYQAWQIARHFNIPFESSAFFPLQSIYFLMGSIGYRVMVPLAQTLDSGKIWVRYVPAISFLMGLAVIFFGYDCLRVLNLADQYLYILFAICVPGIFLFGRNSVLDEAIGEYSYPIYLFHYPIAKSADLFVSLNLEGWFTIALTFVVSVLYIYLVDRKISRIRKIIATR